MTENYADITKLSWDNIPEVKLLPDGSYRLRGRNASFLAAKEEGQNARVLFFLVPQEPMDDVDASELEALGADYDITSNQVVHTIWIERPQDWNKVKAFLTLAGVDVTKQSIAESLKEFKNSELYAHLTSRTFKDKNDESREENVASQFQKVA